MSKAKVKREGMSARTVNVLICHVHTDDMLRRTLNEYLSKLSSRNTFTNLSYNRMLLPTDRWERSLREQLAEAHIILVLITPDLIKPSTDFSLEFEYAFERHYAGDSILIPVLFGGTDLKETPWENLWTLPRGGTVDSYKNHKDAYQDIVDGVSKMIDYYASTLSIIRAGIYRLIEDEKRSKTGVLDLSNLELEVIPEPVFELTWLERLELGGNANRVPIAITLLQNMFREANKITEIPLNIWRLKKLKHLSLKGNPLKNIKNLDQLSQLESLVLEGCGLTQIENLEKLTSLTSLNLAQNKITSCNGLENLSKLRWLTLSNNNLSEIRKLQYLTKLEMLFLDTNNISDISALGGLTNLHTLELFNNQVADIQALSNLKNLNYLRLSGNRVKDISPLKELKNLTRLRLSENRIEDLSPLFDHIENGMTFINAVNPGDREISVAANPIKIPDLSYINGGKESQLAFIKSLNENLVFTNSNILKIILLGNSNCGKTTFRKYLANDPAYKDQKTTLKLEVENVPWDIKNHKNKINLKILDFGGQEYFHGTYPLFFSLETLYVILWTVSENVYKMENSREDTSPNTDKCVINEDFDVAYWLNSIDIITKNKVQSQDESNNNESVITGDNATTSETKRKDGSFWKKLNHIPILLIQNKVDLDGIAYEDLKGFSTSFDRFGIDTLSISLHEDNRLEFMKNVLSQKILETNAHLRQVPERWTKIKEVLKEKFGNEKIIPYQKFLDIAKKEFMDRTKYNDQYFTGIAKYFHSTHDFIYFEEIAGGVIILDTEWFINSIYTLVSSNTTLEYKGIITASRLKEIADKNLTKKESEIFIEILKENKILFDYENERAVGENCYILPQMLPMPERGADKLLYESFEAASVVIKFKYHLHRIMIQALYAQLSKQDKIENRFVYKNGVIIKKGTAMVFIEINQREKQIEFKTTKYSAENNELIREMIFEILSDSSRKDDSLLHFLPTGKDQPYLCIRPTTKNALVPIEKIERIAQDIFINKKIAAISYENNVYDLIDFAPYSYLMKPNTIMPKRVFISYSHKDTDVFNTFISHFNNLKNEGLISAWHDQMLLPGDKWDNKILTELQNADIVFFLVSQDFINSKYIQEKEFKETYKTLKTVIPIKVRSCEYGMFSDSQYANPIPLLPSADTEGEIVKLVCSIRKKIEVLSNIASIDNPEKPAIIDSLFDLRGDF